MTTTQRTDFAVVFAPELARYVVERAGVRVVPTWRDNDRDDPHGAERAKDVCRVLNRVYTGQP